MTTDQEKQQVQLEINAIARNMGEMSCEDQKKLSQGMNNVPVSKMMGQVQYMQEIILPRIQAKEGIEGQNYKFYKGVHDSLLWAILVVDRYNSLQMKYWERKLMEEFWRNQAAMQERELSKYYALEDLTLTESLDSYAKAIAQRAEDLLKDKEK